MVTTNRFSEGVGGRIGHLHIWYPRVGSTMDVAAELARRGAPHGTVVRSDAQIAGRGRHGRAWHAAPGSALLTSWLLRHSTVGTEAGALSPLIALAVARAVKHIVPDVPVALKWPNDVLIDGRKVAGILLTSRQLPAGGVVIVGIGINLEAGAIPEGIEGTSVSEWCPTITADRMMSALSGPLESVWRSYAAHGSITGFDLDEIHALMAWRRERVTVQTGGGVVEGIATGIAADGSLLLQRGGCHGIMHVRVGELIRGPRPAAHMA